MASSVLPTPVGPEEQERAGRPVRVGDARPGPADGVGDCLDGPGLADQPLAELVFHPQQLAGLALQQPAGRDAGPRRDDVGDIVRADLFLDHRPGSAAVRQRPCAGAAAEPSLAAGGTRRRRRCAISRSSGRDLAVHQPRRRLEVSVALGALGLAA